jgi:short-subunit dehydrogenase
MSVAVARSRTILITGASSGLGAALALALAPHGHRLALTARRGDLLDGLAREVRDLGGEALVVPADLADRDAPARIVSAVVEGFGGIDVLINNAGLGLPRYYAQCDPDALRDQIAVNLAAPILLTRHALPHLLAARGTVINIGSAVTTVANPILGVYGATKAGLAYWNDALRRELGHHGLRVCFVDLGPVDTGFFAAVRRRASSRGEHPLGIDPPPDALYNALRDRPPALMEASVEEAARRIIRLVDRPKRRLSLLRRIVWPIRVVGALFHVFPAMGDLAISAMIRRVEREEAAASVSPSRTEGHRSRRSSRPVRQAVGSPDRVTARRGPGRP